MHVEHLPTCNTRAYELILFPFFQSRRNYSFLWSLPPIIEARHLKGGPKWWRSVPYTWERKGYLSEFVWEKGSPPEAEAVAAAPLRAGNRTPFAHLVRLLLSRNSISSHALVNQSLRTSYLQVIMLCKALFFPLFFLPFLYKINLARLNDKGKLYVICFCARSQSPINLVRKLWWIGFLKTFTITNVLVIAGYCPLD